LLNEQKSSHSRTCLSKNACKILFHCYAYAYVALVSMVAGVRLWNNIENGFASRLLFFYFFKLTHLHLEKRECKIYIKATKSIVSVTDNSANEYEQTRHI
ncbi:hypothetical protein T11_12316, partial [Trichinella zimbabwensis]